MAKKIDPNNEINAINEWQVGDVVTLRPDNLPKLPEDLFWKIVPSLPTDIVGTHRYEVVRVPIPIAQDLEVLKADLIEQRKVNLRREADISKLKAEKKSLTEAFDARGKEISDLVEQLQYERSRGESEECGVAEQSPEAKAYEDLHTKRMAAETESIELDNEIKKIQLEGTRDYPEAAYEVLKRKVEELYSEAYNRKYAMWLAIAALGVNEVIQWVTL